MLQCYYDESNVFEIGVDEAGRGPLFGRLYVAAVVLPKGSSFQHSYMKDSKRFHSKKKIKFASDYIKTNAIAWSIQYIDADVIDEINIRQAVFRGMHAAIADILQQLNTKVGVFLLIDGNDFKQYLLYDEDNEEMSFIPHVTIEGGDNKYTAIAAASILAKVARDEYIHDLCKQQPHLIEYYDLDKNQGYGTKKHLDGIVKYGITEWHRKTYGRCKEAFMAEPSKTVLT